MERNYDAQIEDAFRCFDKERRASLYFYYIEYYLFPSNHEIKCKHFLLHKILRSKDALMQKGQGTIPRQDFELLFEVRFVVEIYQN